jgi:hypothetical protein
MIPRRLRNNQPAVVYYTFNRTHKFLKHIVMKKLVFIAASSAMLVLSGCASTPNNNPPATSAPVSTTTGGQKLSDQSYFSSAYLISSDPLSDEAKMALTGFKMDKQAQNDGTTVITLKALEPQYHDQSYTLKSGQQLYFIDKFLADDQGTTEANIADDTAVIIDSDGFIVQGPSGF